MAIAFDAATDAQATAKTISFSHTVASGSDRFLVVCVSMARSSGQTVTGVTYGGATLTLVRANSNSTIRAEEWRRINPVVGSQTVVVNLAKKAKVAAAALSFTGVDQTTPSESSVIAKATSTAPSATLASSGTDGAWVVDCLAFRAAGDALPTLAVGASQTERSREYVEGGAVSARVRQGTSTEGPVSPVGAVTMSWTLGSSVRWAIVVMQIKPAVPTGTTAVNQTAVMNVEASGGIFPTAVVNLEAIQPVARTRAMNIESIAAASQTAVLNIEAALGVNPSATAVLNFEALQGIRGTAIVNFEALGAATEVSQTAAINFEALQSNITQTAVFNLESLLGIKRAVPLNIESIQPLSVTSLFNVESLLGLQSLAAINIEALGPSGVKTFLQFGSIIRQVVANANLTYAFEAILETSDIALAATARLFSVTSEVAIATSSVANPTVITTAAAHGLADGDEVRISEHLGSVPNIDGNHTATLISATTYSIPINVTTAGTSGVSTKGVTVAESEVTTLSAIPVRVRSAAFALSGTKEYRAEFGGPSGGSYTIYAADLVVK